MLEQGVACDSSARRADRARFLSPGEELLDPPKALGEGLPRAGERDSNVIVAAEGSTGDDRDVSLLEQALGEPGGAFGLSTVIGTKAGGDVREGVEGAGGGWQVKPGSEFRRGTTRSRRRSYSAIIASTSGSACSSAATAPTMANDVAFEVACPWIVAAASTSARGPIR